jgi:hypothetical protein
MDDNERAKVCGTMHGRSSPNDTLYDAPFLQGRLHGQAIRMTNIAPCVRLNAAGGRRASTFARSPSRAAALRATVVIC